MIIIRASSGLADGFLSDDFWAAVGAALGCATLSSGGGSTLESGDRWSTLGVGGGSNLGGVRGSNLGTGGGSTLRIDDGSTVVGVTV